MRTVEAMIHPSGKTTLVRCPYCRVLHSHGRGDGPVTAHCTGGGPHYHLVEGKQLTWAQFDKLPQRSRRP